MRNSDDRLSGPSGCNDPSPSPILPFLAPLLEELVRHEGDPVVWAPHVRASDLKAGLERSDSAVEAACGALLRAAVRRYVLSSWVTETEPT